MRRAAVPVALLVLSGCAGTPDAARTPRQASGPSLAQLFERAPEWPGRPWTREGEAVPTDVLSLSAGPEHCDWQDVTFVGGTGLPTPPDGRGGDWVRDPQGVLAFAPQAQSEFRARAALPADAVSTGFLQGRVELWTAPGDRSAYVYLVNARDRDDVERWVRVQAGCA